MSLERTICAGSGTEPLEETESRGRRTGKCSVCTGTHLLVKSGKLKSHRAVVEVD